MYDFGQVALVKSLVFLIFKMEIIKHLLHRFVVQLSYARTFKMFRMVLGTQ